MMIDRKHLKTGVIATWDMRLDRGIIRCGEHELPVSGGVLTEFTVSPHPGLAVQFATTEYRRPAVRRRLSSCAGVVNGPSNLAPWRRASTVGATVTQRLDRAAASGWADSAGGLTCPSADFDRPDSLAPHKPRASPAPPFVRSFSTE